MGDFTYVLLSPRKLGKIPISTSIFSKGMVQPPTIETLHHLWCSNRQGSCICDGNKLRKLRLTDKLELRYITLPKRSTGMVDLYGKCSQNIPVWSTLMDAMGLTSVPALPKCGDSWGLMKKRKHEWCLVDGTGWEHCQFSVLLFSGR